MNINYKFDTINITIITAFIINFNSINININILIVIYCV